MKKFFAFLASLGLFSGFLKADVTQLNKPLVIILLGPPGVGKGTHAVKLAQELNFPHISTGDLLRENLKNETEIGKKAKAYMEEGKLVPEEIVLEMLFDRIAKEDCKKDSHHPGNYCHRCTHHSSFYSAGNRSRYRSGKGNGETGPRSADQ